MYCVTSNHTAAVNFDLYEKSSRFCKKKKYEFKNWTILTHYVFIEVGVFMFHLWFLTIKRYVTWII